MSDAFYIKMQKTATRLLTKFGKTGRVKYMELIAGEPDGIFGGHSNAEYQSHDLIGVMTKVSDALLNKADIQAGDRIFKSDYSKKPDAGGYLLIGGERWNIVVPDETNPAGLPVVYTTIVRKAEKSVGVSNADS